MDKYSNKKYHEVAKLVSIGASYKESFILLTAVHLDLFTTLYQQKLTAEEVSDILKLDERATTVFLDALAALNFLRKEKNVYKNAYYTNTYLVKGKKDYVGDLLKNCFDQIHIWSNIENILKTGKPILVERAKRSKEEQRNFILGMAEFGIFSAKKMLDLIDFSGIKKMLDVGGGAGTYSITFCQNNKKLKSDIIELPENIDITVEQICNAGLEKRINTIVGDFMEIDFNKGYDLILISNMIHYYSLDEVKKLIEKSYNALNEQGKLIVKDYMLDESRIYPKESALYAVGMLLSTEKGDCYSYRQIAPILNDVGFDDLEYEEISHLSKMIVATK